MGENDWYFVLWLCPRCSRESSDFDVDLLLVWGGLFLTCYCFRYPANRGRDGVGGWRQWLGLWLPRQQTLWHLAGVQVWCGGGGGSRFALKGWIFLFLTSLFLATDGTCGPISWVVGVIVAVALLVVCFCSFAGFCCVRHVRRRRGLLDDY